MSGRGGGGRGRGGVGGGGRGVEYWRGFYQSLRPTPMGLSLNIDVSATSFYEPIQVTAFLANYLNNDLMSPLSDQDRIKARKILKNVRVEVSHGKNKRRYRISGITRQMTNQLSFSLNGTDTKITDYFLDQYNVKLRYTALPALISGSDAKPVHLPMEVCRIAEGQKYLKKLNDRQVTAMLDATCQRPEQREGAIRETVRNRRYSSDSPLNQEFGFQIGSELTSIGARVLPPPNIQYHASGRDSLVAPRVGQWNMIDKKMVNGARVDQWACINFSRSIDDDWLCRQLIGMCVNKGMVFSDMPLIPLEQGNSRQVEKSLVDLHRRCMEKSKQLQLLILILPDVSGSYGTIKRICETELGIVSQCINPKKAARASGQYFENVALKINVKVGGRNGVLQHAIQKKIPFLTDRVTIVFGADVTHPAPGEDASPSIAAVVASMDWPEVTKYRGLVSAQKHRQEIIQDLYSYENNKHGGMIREQMIAFRRMTKLRPDRIIFYRDGVSEGQFTDVLVHEMDAIRRACASLEVDYCPRVTFIVVQKRHHTRLFPANHKSRDSTDRSGNILPGTVVDTSICHPTEFDFYLCSHSGIKGTSRPTHYHVLYDENNFNADALQMLTYQLCYTYARCTRSVSIVPPAYYAHLAAFRARYYIEGEYSESGSHTAAGAVGRQTREQENVLIRPLPVIRENVKDVMFYC